MMKLEENHQGHQSIQEISKSGAINLMKTNSTYWPATIAIPRALTKKEAKKYFCMMKAFSALDFVAFSSKYL